jgi:hypothetical protein
MKPGNDFGRAGLRLSAGCVSRSVGSLTHLLTWSHPAAGAWGRSKSTTDLKVCRWFGAFRLVLQRPH